jgi:hypothetical protein
MNTEKAFRDSDPTFALPEGEAAVAWVYTGRRISNNGKLADTFLSLLELKSNAMPRRRLFERAKKNDTMGGALGGVYAVVTAHGGEQAYTRGPKAPRYLFRLSTRVGYEERQMLDLQAEEEDLLPAGDRISTLMTQWAAEDRAAMTELDREKQETKLKEDASIAAQLDALRQLYAETPRFRRPALLAAIINAVTG